MIPRKRVTLQEAIDAIKNANSSLNLDLYSSSLGDAGAELLAESLKTAQAPIILNLINNNIGKAGAECLAQSLKVAQVPITLVLWGNIIGEAGARHFAEAIKLAQAPLNLDLGYNCLGNAGVELLSESLKVVQVPITLNLNRNKIGKAGAKSLAEAIKLAQVPIDLNLRSNVIRNAGVRFLAESLKVARVPIHLNLSENHIRKAGARAIAKSLEVAQVPINLNLSGNDIGGAGVMLIAEAIKATQAPITLSLPYNNIGESGTRLFAEAIKVARSPINLNLSNNFILDAGARFFAEAIKVAQVPINLNLSNNFISEASTRLFAEAIKVARVPLSLNLDTYHTLTSNAQGDNFIIDAGTNPSEFLRQLELSFSKKILEQKLGQISVLASMVQEYVGDEHLAWLEVAAIRAVVGASNDNRYSSINYALLEEAYSTSLVVDVTTVLVLDETHTIYDEKNERKIASRIRDVSSSSQLRKRKQDNGNKTIAKQTEEKQQYDVSSIESTPNSSSFRSSHSSYGSFPGRDQIQQEDLPNKQSAAISPSSIQAIHQQVTQPYQSKHYESTAKILFEKLFTWIKDIPEELQQQMLSSFRTQQLLKFLEATLSPDKFLADQLSYEPMQERFKLEHQKYYVHCDYTSCLTESAQTSQQNYSAVIDASTEATTSVEGILIDPSQKYDIYLGTALLIL